MSDVLEVRHGAQRVGSLRRDVEQRYCFAYESGWTAFPLSISLPIVDTEYVGGAAHYFFSNLLPEGNAREAVCLRLGISPVNDFALLRAIGGECAGAISLVDPATPLDDDPAYRYELLTPAQRKALVANDASLLVGGSHARLSLAGAQDKVPVAQLRGALHLPTDGGPTTHILKLPDTRLAQLPENEAFVLGLARKLGMGVVEASLVEDTSPSSLLVTRYDRVQGDDPWPATRLHQEDLCQALGLSSQVKYEADGGPSFARIVQVIRDNVVSPLVDVLRLIEWQAFNVVSGNSDGHAKNLSLLYSVDGTRLAPFYDLLSTRQYRNLDRRLAMAIGGQRDPDRIGLEQLVQLGQDLKIGVRLVRERFLGVAERTLEALPLWTAEFAERYGKRPILQTLPKEIAKRAKRLAASPGIGSPPRSPDRGGRRAARR